MNDAVLAFELNDLAAEVRRRLESLERRMLAMEGRVVALMAWRTELDMEPIGGGAWASRRAADIINDER